MEFDREHRHYNSLNSKERGCGQGQNRTAATMIFSPLTVAGLCVPIGRYWYLFKRLTAVSAGRFDRFVHIVTYSSGKVVAKSDRARPLLQNEMRTTFRGHPIFWKTYPVFLTTVEIRPRNFGVNIRSSG